LIGMFHVKHSGPWIGTGVFHVKRGLATNLLLPGFVAAR
jgi:hypothetical protein